MEKKKETRGRHKLTCNCEKCQEKRRLKALDEKKENTIEEIGNSEKSDENEKLEVRSEDTNFLGKRTERIKSGVFDVDFENVEKIDEVDELIEETNKNAELGVNENGNEINKFSFDSDDFEEVSIDSLPSNEDSKVRRISGKMLLNLISFVNPIIFLNIFCMFDRDLKRLRSEGKIKNSDFYLNKEDKAELNDVANDVAELLVMDSNPWLMMGFSLFFINMAKSEEIKAEHES